MTGNRSDDEALARFDAWLLTIGDDNDAVDEESGLTGAHVHAVARMAKRFVAIPRLTIEMLDAEAARDGAKD